MFEMSSVSVYVVVLYAMIQSTEMKIFSYQLTVNTKKTKCFKKDAGNLKNMIFSHFFKIKSGYIEHSFIYVDI